MNEEDYDDLDETINDLIDAWHQGKAPEGMPLYEWLGWTKEEYSRWIENPRSIPTTEYGRDDY